MKCVYRAGTVMSAAGLLALAGTTFGASQNFPLGNLAVGDIPGGLQFEQNIATLGFNATRAQFSTDWVAGVGGPWSSEAIWAVANDPLATATTFYFDPGISADSADSGASVTLNWDVYIGGYDPIPGTAGDAGLTFIAGQTFGGSDASWNNSSLTLSDDVATAPASFIDLGSVNNTPFTIDTLGSDFDTELGFFNSAGGLAEADDDGAGFPLSLLDVPALPEGMYFFNAGGFNTIYGSGGYEAIVDGGLGSEGGNLVLNFNGGEVYNAALAADTNQWFKITVVPTPGTAGLLAVAGLAGVRRRR
ncbi:MAG: hypothetical protein AAFX05_04930 [Planctomycetota bacterium]